MVKKKKELSYIECDNTCMGLLELSYIYDICEIKTCINNRSLPNTTKLVGVKEVVEG